MNKKSRQPSDDLSNIERQYMTSPMQSKSSMRDPPANTENVSKRSSIIVDNYSERQSIK